MKNQTFDIKFTPSSFGGGWVTPITDLGAEACLKYFGDGELSEVSYDYNGLEGYMFEPQEFDDIFDFFQENGLRTNVSLVK